MREVIYLVAMPALLALGAVCVALIQRLGIVNPDSTSPEQRRENAALLPFVFILSSISGAAIGMLFYYSIVNVYPERILPQALLPSRSRGTELTVRDFLKPKELEPKGLGLYSYLLYGSPGNSDYDSKIAAMRAYLSDFSTYKETGLIPNRETLNGFFVFTLEDLEWIDQCDREGFVHSKPNDTNSPKIPTWSCTRDAKKGASVFNLYELAEIVVSKFDYQRSYSLLGQLSNAGLLKEMAGIYIVSYISQIRQGSELDYSTVLVQDLSRLPPDYIDSWVELTKTQFGKPQYWDKETLDYQLLRIRTILAQAAPLVTLTESALASDVVKKIWPSQR